MARGCASCGAKPYGMAFRARDEQDRARSITRTGYGPATVNPYGYGRCFQAPLCWGLHLSSLNDYKCEAQSAQNRCICWGLKLFNGDYERRDLCFGLHLTP